MAIDPVKIPQNVHIEDRIIGPLTLRQIIILAVTGGISYTGYTMMIRTFGQISLIATIICWVPLAIGAAFALIKINDLSLMRIVLLTIEGLNKPSKRTFAPRRGISITIRTGPQKSDTQKMQEAAEEQRKLEKTQTRITELSSAVDRLGSEQVQEAEAQTVAVTDQTPAPATTQTTTIEEEDEDAYQPPIDKNRIAVDKPTPNATTELSDLSIFRDIFPSNTNNGHQ